jgi:multiple sugar transport system permease protein
MKRLSRKQQGRWYVITSIILVAFCFPLYWSILNSIKPPLETLTSSWIPFLQFRPTLKNWMLELNGWETRHALLNSAVVSISTTLIVLFIGTLAAYSLATFKFRKIKNQDIMIWFLSQRVMPPVVFVVPFFILMKTLRLLDTRYALIFVDVTFTLPFAVIIMREIFREIPIELTEAALVDGASHWQVFYKITLPLASVGLVAVGIICLAFTWNEFLFALTLSYKEATVMPVLIVGAEHTRGVQFWYVAIRTLLTMSVPIIIALFAQRYLVRGLTLGAVKG